MDTRIGAMAIFPGFICIGLGVQNTEYSRCMLSIMECQTLGRFPGSSLAGAGVE